MSNIPPTLGNAVTSRSFSYEEMVIRQWGEKWRQPDNAYKMSNGTKFDSTDQYLTGIYSRNVVPNNYRLLLDPYLNAQYGDMDGYGLLLDGVSFDGSPGALDLG